MGREDAGLAAWLEGALGSLGGLREEDGLALRVFAGGFWEDGGGLGVILVRAIRRAAKKMKRGRDESYKQNDSIEKKETERTRGAHAEKARKPRRRKKQSEEQSNPQRMLQTVNG